MGVNRAPYVSSLQSGVGSEPSQLSPLKNILMLKNLELEFMVLLLLFFFGKIINVELQRVRREK